ncbi:phage tail protein [Enterococcus asini]|uniref:phage tail protein n=1 Tax=Enterococcus asini TaxID=57732 RepID=UPI000E4A4B71|nr:phage tail protein [Enterococcus asini]RGW15202.1 phage tail protein [Enterococcus asini]
MATELGQAYVQIMPSAKGISGSIQKQLDPEAESAGKSAGSKIGSSLMLAAAAGVAAAGVVLGKTISASLSEGADLQQSLGGIETLFKGSADKVKQYADQAYKTAGLSANDYMTSVTSFSASLLQSMGGDTEAAADKANMALVDMSDNANKMGSNMGDIQNAYQGFAKQNYTMLDNLKLGYGGTKTEMERLLADATKLTGVKYDISNLGDVYDAIHAIQENLDITGTTAKESAETFSGSFASMKAALSNVLGNMSLGRDIQPALTALAETTSTFLFQNFIPMVGNVLKSLPSAVSTFVSQAAPSFIEYGKQLISGLTQGMTGGEGIGVALEGVLSSFQQFGTSIQGLAQNIFGTLGPIIMGSLGTVLGQLPGLFSTVVSTITPFIDMIATAITKLDFSGIQTFVAAIVPAIQNAFTTMMAIIAPAISQVVNSFVSLWNAAQPLIATLSTALMPVLQIVGAFLGGVFKGILMGVSAAFNAIKIAIDILSPVVSFLVGVFQTIAPVLTTVAQWVGTVIGMFTSLGGSGNSLKSILQSAWSNIKNAVSTAGNLIGSAINGIKSVFSSLSSAGNALRSAISSVWSAIRSAISAAGSVIKSIISSVGSGFSAMGNTFSSVGSRISGIIDSVKNVIQGLANIDISGAGSAIMEGFLGGLKSAYEGVKNFVGGIASWIKEHKGPIAYDKKLLIPAGKAIMGGLNTSLQDAFRNVKQTVLGVAGEVQNVIKNGIDMSLFEDDGWNPQLSYALAATNPFETNKGWKVNSAEETDDSGNTQIIYEFSIPVIIDGREVARATATYTQDELNRLARRSRRNEEGRF